MQQIKKNHFFFFDRFQEYIFSKISHALSPRRKRLLKVIGTIFLIIILPIFLVFYGSSYIHKNGGFFSVISRFTDMRIKDVSLIVYNQNNEIIPKVDWQVTAQDILNVLPFNMESYLLDSNPEDVLNNVLTVPWVDHAKVKFRLPDQVIISVTESVPFAIWQENNIFYLIDQKGKKITTKNLERYDYLPWIVGRDANIHADEYVAMMKDFSDLYAYVKAAYRVSNRRWNLSTHNNIQIHLSEKNPRASLEKLAQMQKKYRILNQEITEIDLRIPEKVFLRQKHQGSLFLFNNIS